MAWYSTGEDAERRVQEELDRQERIRNQADRPRYNRWWMPKTTGEDGKFVTFLDDLVHPKGFAMPYIFAEHQLFLNNSWRNWFTCISGMEDEHGRPQKCPLCEKKDAKGKMLHPPSTVAAYSVINHSLWTDKRGNEHRDEIFLFVCKMGVHTILHKSAKRRGGLRGWYTEITRPTNDSPNTGDHFEWFEKRDIPDSLVAPDYREVFAPLSAAELKAIVGDVSMIDYDSEPKTASTFNDGFVKF